MSHTENLQADPAFQSLINAFPNDESFHVDPAVLSDLFEKEGINGAEKAEFLRALIAVITGVIDIGYGVHPAQTLRPTYH